MKFNEAETNAIVEKMKDSGINVDVKNLDAFLRRKGVLVKIRMGGGMNSYTVSPKMYGIDEGKISYDSNTFLKQHVSNGKIYLLPKAYQDKLKTIRQNITNKLNAACIGYDNSYLPLESFDEFEKEFEKEYERFEQIKADIMLNYEALVCHFKQIVETVLKEVSNYKAEKEFNQILSKIPSKKELENKFYFRLDVAAFPVVENLQIFPKNIGEKIEQKISNNAIEMIYEAIGSVLNLVFETCTGVLKGADSNAIHSKKIDKIETCIKNISVKNIFGNIKLIEIQKDLQLMANTNKEEILEMAEMVLANVYAYAKELEVEDMIDLKDSVFSIAELESIYELYKPISA